MQFYKQGWIQIIIHQCRTRKSFVQLKKFLRMILPAKKQRNVIWNLLSLPCQQNHLTCKAYMYQQKSEKLLLLLNVFFNYFREIYIRVLTSIFYPNYIDYKRFQYNSVWMEINWLLKTQLIYFVLCQLLRYL